MNIHNGGITLTLTAGSTSVTLRTVTSYSVSTHMNEKTDSPVSWYDISITSGVMSQADAQSVLAMAANDSVTLTSPDYTGTVYITSISQELVSANFAGKYCRVSLSLTNEPPDKSRITINGISVDLSSYEAQWSYERESFEMYDYSQYNIYKGRRCSISYTTVPLTSTAADALVTAFRNSPVTIGSGDYSGYMAVDSCSKSAVDQGGTTMYTFSVQCTAIALESGTVST